MVPKRITLRDVAQKAGVSLKTASNVINGNGRMSDETRTKVEDVIDELGYKVNVAARNLNRSRTGFITLAVPSLTPPYLSQLANCVIEAARQKGYSVYVTTYAEGSAKGANVVLQSFNATVSDGVILSMSEIEKFTPEQLSVNYPLVCVGARTTWGKADHITSNDVEDAACAARYLLERGSKSLAVIGVRAEFDEKTVLEASEGNAELRLRGVVEGLAAHGMHVNPDLIGYTGHDWSIGKGSQAMQHIIDTGVPFDGLIAFNDQLAIGALSALGVNGIVVPDDVQVIGFDNIEEGAFLQPPLTSVDSRLDWIASTAVDRILSRIHGGTDKPETIQTSSHIVARKTTKE
jgi:DNA-binding LacI/PurR family transcriptional regulator